MVKVFYSDDSRMGDLLIEDCETREDAVALATRLNGLVQTLDELITHCHRCGDKAFHEDKGYCASCYYETSSPPDKYRA